MRSQCAALVVSALAAVPCAAQGNYVETFDGLGEPDSLAAAGWSLVTGTNNPTTVSPAFSVNDNANVVKITASDDAGSQFGSPHLFLENDYLQTEPNNFGRGDALLWTTEPIVQNGATAIDMNGARISIDYSNGTAFAGGPSVYLALRVGNSWWLYESLLLGNTTQQVTHALFSTDPMDPTFTFVPLIFEPWNNYNVDARLIPNDSLARELTAQELGNVTAIGFYTAPSGDTLPVRIDNVHVWGFGLAGSGAAHDYCTGKLNSQGCVPQVTASGIASTTSGAPFLLGAYDVVNQKTGLFFYGFGAANQPFQGGTKCVASPLHRTTPQSSAGAAGGADCSGTFALDFNALAASGIDAALVSGAHVYGQWWYRDPAASFTTGLSNAIEFVLQ